jgi:glycosyltransferase involved in cell wall biosynthesis
MNPVKISVLVALYRCEKYLRGFFEAARKVEGLDKMEFVLIHNCPTDAELAIIQEALHSLPARALHLPRHVGWPERGLYASWNKGIAMSQGEYLANWNVDDARTPDSLLGQAETLDRNPDVALTYGDIIEVTRQGATDGRFSAAADARGRHVKFRFSRAFHGHCFLMWRRSAHDQAGYFDEQLHVAGDYDFWIRVVSRLRVMKTEGLLGYYLNEGVGLSTSGPALVAENTLLFLRYSLFEKLNYLALPSALHSYRVRALLVNGQHVGLDKYWTPPGNRWLRNPPLFLGGLLLYPFRFLVPQAAKFLLRLPTWGPAKCIARIERNTAIPISRWMSRAK